MLFGVGHFKAGSFVKGCKLFKIFVISSTDSNYPTLLRFCVQVCVNYNLL